ncbi:short-chain dehydrogenase/reductase SDR [Magnetococcus marinus MC-1]|uniref:Short-chain dehydrogenase/reductase SDR n=1 Tax=Magnetococcus marinus (strain ATCC BAA-1437 / JCM 17883 / MC-1) TaxID=156889 RepID=A0L6R0_MAGMM|nr:SDR family NAD(P)-dependent oxidoreductase [Magnetococcus marinus]ABK43653.1 short-chain dehydrogenase/reductase SDR [Magnetococcus marinus MC-1]
MTQMIVGASAGLGRALAEHYAQKGHPLLLISSDSRDCERMVADLSLRFGVQVRYFAQDLSNGDWPFSAIEARLSELPPLKGVLLPVGFTDDADLLTIEPKQLEKILRVNFTSVAMFISHFLPHLRSTPGSKIVAFGSISSIRGRGRNIIYSSAKRALISYFESLAHGLNDQGPAVWLINVGYLATNQSFAQRTLLPPQDPHQLAKLVQMLPSNRSGIRFWPGYWRWIALILRMIPWFIYKRLSF